MEKKRETRHDIKIPKVYKGLTLYFILLRFIFSLTVSDFQQWSIQKCSPLDNTERSSLPVLTSSLPSCMYRSHFKGDTFGKQHTYWPITYRTTSIQVYKLQSLTSKWQPSHMALWRNSILLASLWFTSSGCFNEEYHYQDLPHYEGVWQLL